MNQNRDIKTVLFSIEQKVNFLHYWIKNIEPASNDELITASWNKCIDLMFFTFQDLTNKFHIELYNNLLPLSISLNNEPRLSLKKISGLDSKNNCSITTVNIFLHNNAYHPEFQIQVQLQFAIDFKQESKSLRIVTSNIFPKLIQKDLSLASHNFLGSAADSKEEVV